MRLIELHRGVREAQTAPLPGIARKLQHRIRVPEGALVKEGIENLKLRQVHAHPERQHGDCAERESRRAAQHSRTVAQILPQLVEPRPRPHLARILAQPGGVSEVRAAVGRHHFAVGLHLFRQLTLQTPPVQQKIDPRKQLSHSAPHHGPAQARRRIA